jgi:AAA15 family ATPase/GTPase
MLIEFSVGNYRSFKEKVTFSMVAANLVAKDKKLDENNVFTVNEDLKLLKSAAIYGANASGKSNLAKALVFMKKFMIDSSRETQSVDKIKVEPFRLSTETEKEPSFFELVFLVDNVQYRYGFEANQDRVISEWLFYVPKLRETKLFERKLNNISISKQYKAEGLQDKTRNNSLFLSVSAQFNVGIAEKILTWLSHTLNLVSVSLDDVYIGYTTNCLADDHNRLEIIKLIKNLDLGISEINVKSIDLTMDYIDSIIPFETPEISKEGMRNIWEMVIKEANGKETFVTTLHKKFDSSGNYQSMEKFNLERHESEGTQKLFVLAGYLVTALKEGKILVIDELESQLHPLISQAIVKLFNSNKTNPNDAQLIFMTHDTNLLSNKLFRRDQIWFTEKNHYGATALYSLAEYNIRNDASFESDYIKGRYGAIPYLGDLSNLVDIHG